MKFKVPQNRIAPLIILAIISLFISLSLGLFHMEKMIQYSYNTMNEKYNSLAENTAILLSQNIQNNYQSVQVSANLVGQAGELTKERIINILPILGENDKYIDLAIVNKDGYGYRIDGSEIFVSEKIYFLKAIKGEINVSDSLTYRNMNEPVMIYAAPIVVNNEIDGVLLATVSAQMDDVGYKETPELMGSIIYVLNSSNQLVAYSKGSDIINFYYGRAIANGYLYKKGQEQKIELNIRNIYLDENRKETYIWYQKPIGINKWTVLIGRKDQIDPVAQDIIKLTYSMWTIVLIGIIVLFLMMIIFQRRSNRKLVRMLYYDPVTGGNNWYKFKADVNRILNSRLYRKKRYALINFDIHRFKIINDAYGYQKGDEILKDIAIVLKKWVKSGEPYGRYSADQFYLMLSYHQENEVMERINDLIDRVRRIKNTRTAKLCFGVYYISERRDSVDKMSDYAKVAKNAIKGSAEGIISYFDDATKIRLLKEEEIEKTMYDALKKEEFVVYLQPKYRTLDESMYGAEALVRWVNEKGNIISPGYFIPIFEKNGFITELDNYMLRKVCEVFRRWLDSGYNPKPISVNISRIHFADPNLADNIKNIVDEYNIPHELIELELSESAFFENKHILIKTVVMMKKYGFLISMDDFGAGYSSLNSLKDIPLDVVKLDRELFYETDDLERGHTVIRNTISMAKDLNMLVVAEGIETKEQVEFLAEIGCDIIQGYYFAKPMPVAEFEDIYFKSKE